MDTQGVEYWECKHVSLANPIGEGQEDLPSLLRRFADLIEKLGEVEIMDLTVENETTSTGPWWSITMYFDFE